MSEESKKTLEDEKQIEKNLEQFVAENGIEVSTDQQGDQLNKTDQPIQESEKRKRGRPRKNKTADQQKPKSPEPKEEKNEINDFFKEFNGIEPTQEIPEPVEIKPKKRRGRPKGSTNRKEQEEQREIKLSGEMLLTGINFAMPVLIKMVYGLIDERAKEIDTANLRLDKEEKAELQDSADEVAKQIFGNANPVYVFIAGLLFVFGDKVTEEVAKIPKKPKK